MERHTTQAGGPDKDVLKAKLSLSTEMNGEEADSNIFDRALSDLEDGEAVLKCFRDENYGRLLFSSFQNGNYFDEFFKRLESGAKGGIRGQYPLEFFTLGDFKAKMESDVLAASASYLLNVMVLVPSNVGGNFYISLGAGSNAPSMRFSNFSVSLRNSPVVVMHDMRKVSIYSMAVADGFVYLFVDGILKARKSLEDQVLMPKLILELIGDPAADISALVYGVDLYSDCESFLQRFVPPSAVQTLLKNALAESTDPLLTYNTLVGFDGIDLRGMEREAFDFLDSLLSRKGFQEWILNFVLERLPTESRELWLQTRSMRLPKASIQVESLGVKLYRRPDQILSLKRIIRGRPAEKFDALKDINFKIFPGDIVGILGHNGAGKSTLLKTIAGLIPINSGKVTIAGHHLLLSPGLGIREELSGRENIFLVCCFMGVSRKDALRIEKEVIDFSELGENIDRAFKFYSDGMKSRLIFSIATSIAPEILMLDELLSAGDIKFQKKAADRMDQMIAKARIVIVVTHSLAFVETKCNKAILVMGGKQLYYGSPKVAIARYLDCLHMTSAPAEDKHATQLSMLQQF